MKDNVENCETSDALPQQVTYALASLHGIIFFCVSIYTFITIRKDKKFQNANWCKQIEYYSIKKKKSIIKKKQKKHVKTFLVFLFCIFWMFGKKEK